MYMPLFQTYIDIMFAFFLHRTFDRMACSLKTFFNIVDISIEMNFLFVQIASLYFFIPNAKLPILLCARDTNCWRLFRALWNFCRGTLTPCRLTLESSLYFWICNICIFQLVFSALHTCNHSEKLSSLTLSQPPAHESGSQQPPLQLGRSQ